METRRYGLTESPSEQYNQTTGYRALPGIFAEIGAVRAVYPNDKQCLGCEWLSNDATGTQLTGTPCKDRHTRSHGAGKACVSVFVFLFFQRRKKYQVGTASEFDAARERRKVARVTSERPHALLSHMLVRLRAYHASHRPPPPPRRVEAHGVRTVCRVSIKGIRVSR